MCEGCKKCVFGTSTVLGSALDDEAPADDSDLLNDTECAKLSHIGKAAYRTLLARHANQYKRCWNVTSGAIRQIRQTPYGWERGTWDSVNDPPEGHDKEFPERMGELISMTEYWCDVTSLSPPDDGHFMDEFKKAVVVVAKKSMRLQRTIILRFLFGNIAGMPVNCTSVIKELTRDLPEGANIQLWVGAWRKGVSWNHSKIIAIDGKYLFSGGHNLWDRHYLRKDCIHDVSMEIDGRPALDGHNFANQMWLFVNSESRNCCGRIINCLPDGLPVLVQSRVTVSEYPEGQASVLPPMFDLSKIPDVEQVPDEVPLITMGRLGSLLRSQRPSDDAFVAMFKSAQTIIRMSLQDVGPICIPYTDRIAVPGTTWPHTYLKAWGRAIYYRDVDIEIALSNPKSMPDGLGPTEAQYGNGWRCADVAAEIIRAIMDDVPNIDDARLREMVNKNLRLCYIRQGSGHQWQSGMNMGNHAKHFIIDDKCYYIGSQNLYVADLAEWGVLVDDEGATERCLHQYWAPMWRASFEVAPDGDCDIEEVMNGLKISRDGESVGALSRKAANMEAQLLSSNLYKGGAEERFHDEAVKLRRGRGQVESLLAHWHQEARDVV